MIKGTQARLYLQSKLSGFGGWFGILFGDCVESMSESHREKSFWVKNLEIKTLVKKSQFSEVLGQNVTGKME